jgi:hypothetical protein
LSSLLMSLKKFCNKYTKVGGIDDDRHNTILDFGINYGSKKFIVQALRPNVIKPFTAVIIFWNKLERLSLAYLSSLV